MAGIVSSLVTLFSSSWTGALCVGTMTLLCVLIRNSYKEQESNQINLFFFFFLFRKWISAFFKQFGVWFFFSHQKQLKLILLIYPLKFSFSPVLSQWRTVRRGSSGEHGGNVSVWVSTSQKHSELFPHSSPSSNQKRNDFKCWRSELSLVLQHFHHPCPIWSELEFRELSFQVIFHQSGEEQKCFRQKIQGCLELHL